MYSGSDTDHFRALHTRVEELASQATGAFPFRLRYSFIASLKLRSKSLRPSRECPKLPQGLLLGHAKAANWNLIWVEMW